MWCQCSPPTLNKYIPPQMRLIQSLAEVLFRNYNQTLIDNASSEYFFLTDFLGHTKWHDITALFSSIFSLTLSLSLSVTKHLVANTTDIYSILLCIRLTQRYAFTLQKRRMPTLEGYINSTNMLLWPKFQVLMDQQAESLRRFGLPSSTREEASLAPLAVSQRFAGLLEGLLVLSGEGREDEPLGTRYLTDDFANTSLGRVRSDFEAFLTRWSTCFADGKRRERFLYNNYSLVRTVLEVTHFGGESDSRAWGAKSRSEKSSISVIWSLPLGYPHSTILN
jgi:vacuolar protein sorting-associated protein 52